ncbi:MAG: transglycosylase domain-containing protein [Acidobacteriota bacterium]|nr:transglycosylase domain-containing protein [Acidobacteriota bacterium]
MSSFLRDLPTRLLLVALLLLLALPAGASLEDELGRNQVRVFSAPYPLQLGVHAVDGGLPARLERLGYVRVSRRPEEPGEYFWGHERFWIYRRSHFALGDEYDALLMDLELDDAGRIERILDLDGEELDAGSLGRGELDDWDSGLWLEPETVAESLTERRARRRPIELARLPEHVWRPVLAAEDSRFFDHAGLDARGIARALLANARAGKVVQGGSTITQQLIKMRDLSPKRSLGRKVSEAMRSLELEAEYDKEEILQAYLNHVYLGHLDGVSIYGYGAAARAYFSKSAAELSLAEASALAAMIQGPNRLSPARNAEANRRRQQWVLDRMEELEWASSGAVAAARRAPVALALDPPAPRGDRQLVAWVSEVVEMEAPRRFADGRGFVVDTTFDPLLQAAAADTVEEHLQQLRRSHSRLRREPLSAALVTLDLTTGAVLAAVAGDPGDREDAFDRVRNARRQPGSAIKPLVLLEAFSECGGEDPLYPARRVADRPLRLDLPSGPWAPSNFHPGHRGTVTVREALVDSLNVPFVRIARHCGFEATAEQVQSAGVRLPKPPPPSFVLGAVETSPLDLARAYSVFAHDGERVRPYPVRRLARPAGGRLARARNGERRVVDAAAAYLVRDLLRDAVARGTGRAAALEDIAAWGKTGTSDQRRDAWFVGGAGNLLTAVWVGIDDGTPLGLTGSQAAAPLWRDYMQLAAASYAHRIEPPPVQIVERWVQTSTGLLVRRQRSDATLELFRRGDEPDRRRLLRADHPIPELQ